MTIRFKLYLLIALISSASFLGFGLFIHGATSMGEKYEEVTNHYIDSFVTGEVNRFMGALDTYKAVAGVSPSIGEAMYTARANLSRAEVQAAMEHSMAVYLKRHPEVEGGGIFYDANVFYPDVYDFHLYSYGNISASSLKMEWEWDAKTFEEPWYLAALPAQWNRNQKRAEVSYWSEAYVEGSSGVLMVSVVTPMYSAENKIIGVGTIDVSLKTLQEMVFSLKKPVPGARIVAFSTMNQAIFASSESENSDLIDYDKSAEQWLDPLKKLQAKDSLLDTNYIMDGKVYSVFAQVGESGIGLAMLMPHDELYAAVTDANSANIRTGIGLTVALLLIVGVVCFVVQRQVLQPLNAITGYTSDIEKGNLDAKLSGEFTGEMHQLSTSIASMVGFLKKEMSKAEEHSREAAELAKEAEKSRTEVEARLAAEQERQRRIMDITKRLAEVANSLSLVSNAISAQANQIQSGSAVQRTELASTIDAISTMEANFSEIVQGSAKTADSAAGSRREAEKGAGVVSASAQALSDIKSRAETLMGSMQVLDEKSKDIGTIMTMIEDVADQTNLLALNAAIEAARAGEAGRGFAVVADEVRKLAEKTMIATADVEKAIASIQSVAQENVGQMKSTLDFIEKATALADESRKALEAIVGIAHLTAEQVQGITDASSQQIALIRDITSFAQNVNQVSESTADQVDLTLTSLHDLLARSDDLQKIMHDLDKA